MKATHLRTLPDGTPLIGGVECLKCHRGVPTAEWIDDQGLCLSCDWEFGVPEDEIEVLWEEILVHAGQYREKLDTVTVMPPGDYNVNNERHAMVYAWRRLADLHPEAFGLFVEQWYAQNGLPARRRIKRSIAQAYRRALTPIIKYIRDKETAERDRVR